MPQVPISQGPRVQLNPLPQQDLQATDISSVGRAIGAGMEQLGQTGADFARAQEQIAEVHDEAAVKEQTNAVTSGFLDDAYTSDGAYFKTKGRDALMLRPSIEQRIDDRVNNSLGALKNERQKAMFRDAIIPQRQRWALAIASHANAETLQYGIDQASSRVDTALNAGVASYPTDPVEGEKQLGTAFGEIDSLAKLKGWSPEVVAEKKRDAQSKLLSEVALNAAVSDPIKAWTFIEDNQDRMNAERVIQLQTELRPRYLRQQGINLADHLAGLAPKASDGSTRDPLAPLPAGATDPDTVWARMVGPDGRGGIEAGTNADGSFRTSPKGAIGPAQVMPGTAPEAARLAGLPYDEHRYKTDAAYNLALGRAYYNAQLAKFGDPVLAAAAYNAGPGRIVAALRKGGADGWMAHVPTETRNYVAAIGGGTSGHGTAADRSTLGEQLRAIDNLDVPEEVKASAREVVTRRAQTDSLIAKDEHDQWLNSFLVSLHDGTAGSSDIAAARKAGKLTDYDEITRAEGIVNAREKDSADLTNFNRMMGDPHFAFNQYDDAQRKAVEAGVTAMGGGPAAALKVWERTGILAKSGAVALRGALVSTDGKAVRDAANIAGNMLRRNPNAFAGVEGQSDIEHAAVDFNHYVFDLGMAPDKAAARVAQENDPKFKEKVKYTDPQRQDAMKQLRQNGGVQAQRVFKGAQFPNPEQRDEANQTYHEMIVDGLSRGLDLGGAQSQAAAQMRKVYGVNSRGRIVKYAPEAIYPAIGGSHAYIYKDAERTVKQETGRDPVAVNLVPIPGVTDQDFRAGRPARYRLLYSYKKDGQTIIDAVPGQFAADTEGPLKELATRRRRSFAQERRQSVQQQQALRSATDAMRDDPALRATGAFH